MIIDVEDRPVSPFSDSPKANRPSRQLIVTRGDQTPEKPLRYLWKPYLPQGKLVLFGGNSSQAKSPVVVDLAARVTAGSPWPDGTPNHLGPRSVIMLNIEDGWEDTTLPRFRLAGGDKSKIYHVKGTKNSSEIERGLSFTHDMELVIDQVRKTPDLGMFVVDPITNYLGQTRMCAEERIRQDILTPIAQLAEEFDFVALTVAHLNRREKGTDPLHRMMGAAAFAGVARAVYAFGPDPDEESKFAHVMTVVRSCGGDGSALRYHTVLVPEKCSGSLDPTEIIKVVWDGKSDTTAEQSVDPVSRADKAEEAKAASMLKDILRTGRRPAKECTEILKEEGYDLEKLNAGRVRRKAGADSKKFPGDRFNSWFLKTPG